MTKLVLHGHRPLSWNKMYSGMHHMDRSREVARIHEDVRAATLTTPQYLYTKPVDICISAYFKNRPLDADNIAAKIFIDALKGWLIKDDSPEFVRSVKTQSLVDKDNPRLEIVIEEVGE